MKGLLFSPQVSEYGAGSLSKKKNSEYVILPVQKKKVCDFYFKKGLVSRSMFVAHGRPNLPDTIVVLDESTALSDVADFFNDGHSSFKRKNSGNSGASTGTNRTRLQIRSILP